ncbi:hypothetical protein Q0F98_26655 [Paenibacillus amylolyticus]|nr:hypothetical protein Q0F98_26655 [Paenibacillus amylolyticus]
MKMNVQITSILAEQKELFLNLYNLYLYDLSEFSGEDLRKEGTYDPTNTYLYLERDELHPFLIQYEGKVIGFCTGVLTSICAGRRGLYRARAVPGEKNIADRGWQPKRLTWFLLNLRVHSKWNSLLTMQRQFRSGKDIMSNIKLNIPSLNITLKLTTSLVATGFCPRLLCVKERNNI